jgi:aryl-phospho-beta-D-glucosidase BglC (GH1 family)
VKFWIMPLIVVAAVAGSNRSAAGPLTPAEAVRQMGPGINLGNTLESPQEGVWDNGPAREYYFDDYKRAGFKCVRIPVRWDEHTATNAPYDIDKRWMDRVDQIVDWGLARGLFIIINAHHEEWLKTHYDDPAKRERFRRIWVQISERFKGKSDHLLFEILNEPHGMTIAQVNDMNANILKIIRAANPTRLVIFTGDDWSQPDRLIAAAAPKDPYVIGTFHLYSPAPFANDGKGTWGSKADRDALHQEFEQVNAWSAAHGIPVLLGEFGAVSAGDASSRRAFYAAHVSEAQSHWFAFTVWDDGGKFRVYQRAVRSWNELKDLLVTTPPGP